MPTFKLDSNHLEIKDAFGKLGAYVVDNATAERYEEGILDLFVGFQNPYKGDIGVWIYVEVKTDDGQLSIAQETAIKQCTEMGLPVEVVRSTADVEKVYHRWSDIMWSNADNRCDICGGVIPVDSGICEVCIPY